MVFMLFSHIVATVDVSKKKDGNGNEIPLTPVYTAGLVRYVYCVPILELLCEPEP